MREIKLAIAIGILLVLFDRIEYLYYAFPETDKFCLILWKERCYRMDSFIYYFSGRVQQVITTIMVYLVIVYLKLPLRKHAFLIVVAWLLSLIELFITYNEPITKVPLPRCIYLPWYSEGLFWKKVITDWYIPISTATLKLISVLYFAGQTVSLLWRKIYE